MPTLSVCLIVKNEEAFLERCLSSIEGVADEIIVVDTGSSDRTEEIARGFTSLVYQFEWCDDFSKARNEAIKYATKDWVLFLDADETIASRDLASLKEALTFDVDAYQFVTRTYIDKANQLFFVPADNVYYESKGFVGWISAKMVRLFRNNGDFAFTGRIHESLVPSLKAKKAVISEIPVPIHHFGLTRSVSDQREKKHMYGRIGELKLQENEGDPKALFEQAKRAVMDRKVADARKLLEKVREKDPDYSKLYTLLVYVYGSLGEFDLASRAYEAGINNQEGSPLLLNMAIVLQKMGKDHEVIDLLSKKELSVFAYHSVLGRSHYNLGNLIEAKKYFSKALDLDPDHEKTCSLLVDTLLQTKEYPAAINLMKKAVDQKHSRSNEFIELIDKMS